jgi:hypothetical protein
LIRAFVVATVCVAMFAVLAPASFAQVVDTPPVDPGAGGPPADVPPTPPVEQPPVVEPPPEVAPPVDVLPDPGPPSEPPQGSPPEEITPEPPAERPRETPSARPDPTRTPAASSTTQPTAPVTTPADSFAPPAPLPAGGGGDDFAWTEKGDAFVYDTGGSTGTGGKTAVLGSFVHFGSIASASAGIATLDARERAVRQAAARSNTGAGIVLVDSSGNTMLFFRLFGGGGGGGAALVMLVAFGLLTVYRLIPPDRTQAFRNSTALWRPSAYVPPLEHPG